MARESLRVIELYLTHERKCTIAFLSRLCESRTVVLNRSHYESIHIPCLVKGRSPLFVCWPPFTSLRRRRGRGMRSLELDLRWQAPDECDGLPKPNGYRSHRFTSDEIENDTHRVLFAFDVVLKKTAQAGRTSSSPNPFSS